MTPCCTQSNEEICSAGTVALSKQVWTRGGDEAGKSANEAEALSDEQLISISRMTNAERRAEVLNELFCRYQSRVGVWCYRVTGDRATAADLAQEIFLRVYQNLDSFEGQAKFSTWLYSVTRNHCLNHLQSKGTRKEETVEPEVFEAASAYTEHFESRIDRANSVKSLQSLLDTTLEDTERAVMTLHYGEEMKLEAITRVLGLTNPSGAKAYVVSARRKLSAAVAKMKRRPDRG